MNTFKKCLILIIAGLLVGTIARADLDFGGVGGIRDWFLERDKNMIYNNSSSSNYLITNQYVKATTSDDVIMEVQGGLKVDNLYASTTHSVYGKTVTVAKSGADFALIQDAIDSITDASSTNPYTVMVYAGVYNERVIMSDYINIIGVGRESTIITYGGTDRGTVTMADHVTLENVSVINTYTTSGIAVVVDDDDYFVIRNAVLNGKIDCLWSNDGIHPASVGWSADVYDTYFYATYDAVAILSDDVVLNLYNCELTGANAYHPFSLLRIASSNTVINAHNTYAHISGRSFNLNTLAVEIDNNQLSSTINFYGGKIDVAASNGTAACVYVGSNATGSEINVWDTELVMTATGSATGYDLYQLGGALNIYNVKRSGDTSGTITGTANFSNLDMDNYIYHTGDHDTFTRYLDNRYQANAGGNSFLDLVGDTGEFIINPNETDINTLIKSIDQTALFVDGVTGYVGIASSSPTNLLTLKNDTATSSGIRLGNDMYVYRSGNGKIAFDTTYDYGGKLELDPSWQYGAIWSYTGPGSNIRWDNALMMNNNTDFKFGSASNYLIRYDTAPTPEFHITDSSASNTFLSIRDQGTTADVAFNVDDLFVGDNGLVGVGTTTPQYRMTVTDGGTDAAIHFDTNTYGAKIITTNGSNDGILYLAPSNPTVRMYDGTQNYRLDAYAGAAVGMRLNASGNSYFNGGNLGVGSTTPETPFVVEGDSGAYRTGFVVDMDDSTYGPTIHGYTTRDQYERLFVRGTLTFSTDQIMYYGTGSKNNIRYTSEDVWKFGSTDVDGIGTNGDVFTITQGTDDVIFNGGIEIGDNSTTTGHAFLSKIKFEQGATTSTSPQDGECFMPKNQLKCYYGGSWIYMN